MKRFAVLLLTLALLAALLSGCSGGKLDMSWLTSRFSSAVSNDAESADASASDDASDTHQTPTALVTETGNELSSYGLAYQAEYGLDPYNCMSLNNRVILSFLYEPLFAVNDSFEAEPFRIAAIFELLKLTRDELEVKLNRRLPILSMGMSGDFEIAARHGSTLVRVGSLIFGAR